MRTFKITQPFVSKVRKVQITVISEENKPLNIKEQKSGVITVITLKANKVIDEVETVSTYWVVTVTSLNCKIPKEVVTVTTQNDISLSGNVSKNPPKPALNLEADEKLSTGKGNIPSVISPVIKSANVTGLSIDQSSLNDFDTAKKSASVAHLRGAQ